MKFVKSYFRDRRQQVKFGDSVSDLGISELGVVQGSKTGPLYFDIYSNDLNYLLTNDEQIFYADDTCLVFVGENLERLQMYAQDKMKLIQKWCHFNKLSLNASKCEFMVITNSL